MARLYSIGYEHNSNTTEGQDFQNASTTTTSPIRSGTYSFQSNAAQEECRLNFNGGSDASTNHFFRIYVRFTTLAAGLYTFFQVIGGGAALTKVSLRINGVARTLELWNDEDTVQVGSDSSALTLDTWYRIELNVDSTTIASTALDARIDGVSFASGTVNLDTGMRAFTFGDPANNVAHNYQFDDVAVNNSSGSFQNSYPGEGEIIHLRPNAVGDTDAWDALTTFEDIDEVTPDDATTLISSLTAEDTHEVNIDATPAALASDDTVNVVQVGVRFNESVGTDPDPIFVLRIKASAGGTTEESASITANATVWNTNATANPRNYQLTLYDLPGASTTPWTKTDLDATQIGVRLTNSPVGLAQVSTMWLLVDHKPAAAATAAAVGYRNLLGVGI